MARRDASERKLETERTPPRGGRAARHAPRRVWLFERRRAEKNTGSMRSGERTTQNVHSEVTTAQRRGARIQPQATERTGCRPSGGARLLGPALVSGCDLNTPARKTQIERRKHEASVMAALNRCCACHAAEKRAENDRACEPRVAARRRTDAVRARVDRRHTREESMTETPLSYSGQREKDWGRTRGHDDDVPCRRARWVRGSFACS